MHGVFAIEVRETWKVRRTLWRTIHQQLVSKLSAYPMFRIHIVGIGACSRTDSTSGYSMVCCPVKPSYFRNPIRCYPFNTTNRKHVVVPCCFHVSSHLKKKVSTPTRKHNIPERCGLTGCVHRHVYKSLPCQKKKREVTRAGFELVTLRLWNECAQSSRTERNVVAPYPQTFIFALPFLYNDREILRASRSHGVLMAIRSTVVKPLCIFKPPFTDTTFVRWIV